MSDCLYCFFYAMVHQVLCLCQWAYNNRKLIGACLVNGRKIFPNRAVYLYLRLCAQIRQHVCQSYSLPLQIIPFHEWERPGPCRQPWESQSHSFLLFHFWWKGSLVWSSITCFKYSVWNHTDRAMDQGVLNVQMWSDDFTLLWKGCFLYASSQ